MEGLWRDLNITLEEKQKSSRARAEQLNAYERLRETVLDWLSRFEAQVGRLEPVALELNILKRQTEELKVSRLSLIHFCLFLEVWRTR